MAIKVLIKITGQDKKGNIIEYKPGTVIKLSDDEEERLINLKAAEEVAATSGSANNSGKDKNSDANSTGNDSGENGPATSYPGA
jgi:hypothetical protein